jgi:prolyl-tRNA synthetase
MRLSRYFVPLLKEDPVEAHTVSHRYMLRAGMIRPLTSGIYTWLPFGLAVLQRVSTIIREEMQAAGAQEVLMPAIQPAELWEESGRYDGYGKEMLRMRDRHDRPILFGPTHEEVITDLFRHNVHTYRDLPLNLYQIQWKFRDEVRPRFGVMRGREFLMKDAYSFDVSPEAMHATYHTMMRAYLRMFRRMGICVLPVRADNGVIGGDLSHEFHVLAETGESTLYYDAALEDHTLTLEDMATLYAVAEEKHTPEQCPVPPERLRSSKGIEVGHVFGFGTKYTTAMQAYVADASGGRITPYMGSYGIGVSRVVAAIIEAHHDDKGMCWPVRVAPFTVSLLNLKQGDATCDAVCETLYTALTHAGITVLYDDRQERPGSKFASAALLGMPYQIAVGPKGLAEGVVEMTPRKGEATAVRLPPEQVVSYVHSTGVLL